MADNVTLPGAGVVVGADEVTIGAVLQQVQRVKLVDGTDGGTGLIPGDATNGLQVNVARGTVSTNNSTTSTLLAAATFTGTGEDVTNYSSINVTVIASHVSATDGLSIQQSTDNSNWDITDTYTIPATTGKTYLVPRQARYLRVVYTNGGTNQSSFRLQTILNRDSARGSSNRAGDAYTNETDLDQNQVFLMGYNGTTWDRLRTTGTGVLTVSAAQATGSNLHTVVDSGTVTTVTTLTGTTTLTPGTGAANLGKAEDSAATDGDVGVLTLGVRRDTPTSDVSAAGDYASFQVSKLGAQWVLSAAPFAVQVTSGGLTTATTAYTTGDQVGTQFTVANAALATGGGGYIEAAWVNDETAIVGNLRLWVFNASVTPASDNAAFSISDADAEKLACPPIELGPALSAGLSNTPYWIGSMPFVASATSLFVLIQTLSGHTFFGATTSLKLNLLIARTPA